MSTSFDPRIVVRPRTLDETIDLALAYVRVGQRDFIPLFLWLTGLGLAVCGGLDLALGLSEYQTWIAVLIVGAIFERVVTAFGGRHLFGEKIPLRQAAVQAARYLPATIMFVIGLNLPWILLLYAVEEDLSSVVAVVVVAGLCWPFVVAAHLHLREVLILEHLPLYRSLPRARGLIRHRFERGLGLLAISLVVRVIVVFVAYSWIRFATEFLLQFSQVPEVLISWSGMAGWLVAGQVLALARLFDYVDARTRREGWDIQIRFDAIKAKDAAARARRMAA